MQSVREFTPATECPELVPGSDIYPVLSTLAYGKSKELELALKAAMRTIEVNPSNADASAIVGAMEDKQRK